MAKFVVPPGWTCQAYRFEVDRPSRHRSISSHEGARRFAWNWALELVEHQLQARDTYRVLALRQGATTDEATAWAKEMVRVPWSLPALRRIWNTEKHEIAPWWSENSKECYSSAFEALSAAFKNYYDSRSGIRHGPRVGWPRYKRRSRRQSVAFTTGAIAILDRHHVQLPVIGRLRVKEPTDKLGRRLGAGTARILRATLVSDGRVTNVSFSVLVERGKPSCAPAGACGHDVGISSLVTGSDGNVVENAMPAAKSKPKIRRYQRRIDRQHRAGSPRCFNDDGTHIKGACYWSTRSVRADKNKHKLARAHRQASNARKDAVHKASHQAATTYAVNVVEDLNVEGMVRRGRGKRGFNGAAHDAALAELRRQLAYKCPWYGSTLWVASRWYPSSKLCSRCRVKNADLPRSARVFHCDACGLVIDRDLNAAKNLAALAELACACLMAQVMTGQPVDWSSLPIRPAGWELDKGTRSSRGCARARGRKADGGERKTAQASSAGDRSFDREAAVATGSVVRLGGASPSPKKAVA
jgi:putative transposase